MKKKLVLTVAKYLGLFHLSRLATKRRIRILGYHGIWFSAGHFGNHLFMDPEKFDHRMRWLSASPYSVVSLKEAVADLARACVRPYSVVVTIDDGWYGTFRYMLPSLEKYGLGATLYVYTGKVESQEPLLNIMIPALVQNSGVDFVELTNPVDGKAAGWSLRHAEDRRALAAELVEIVEMLPDNERDDFCRQVVHKLGFDYDQVVDSRQFSFMTFDEVEEADRRGFDIQLHTHSHHLDPHRPEQVSEEIRINREMLRPHVKSSLDHFCYPSGVFSEAMFKELEQSDVKSATLVETGLAREGDERFALKRIFDGQKVDLLEFEAELSGFMELLRDLKRVIRASRSAR